MENSDCVETYHYLPGNVQFSISPIPTTLPHGKEWLKNTCYYKTKFSVVKGHTSNQLWLNGLF